LSFQAIKKQSHTSNGVNEGHHQQYSSSLLFKKNINKVFNQQIQTKSIFSPLQQIAIGSKDIQSHIQSDDAHFNISNISINNIQAKLKVSQPDDAYEQEADRVAERVMNLLLLPSEPVNATVKSIGADTDNNKKVNRKCIGCEMKNEEEEEEEEEMMNVSRKASNAKNNLNVPDSALQTINDVVQSGGSSLDASTEAFMESRFGHDFSNIRIHTDEMAARSSNSLNALAYTVGNHIAFGAGRYSPNRLEGRKLIAHELTHVLQQGTSK
jgi:hypothetical protein